MLGLLKGIGRNCGDALPHKAGAILRKHGNIAIAAPIKNATDVLSGDHGADARRFLSTRHIDVHDARMGIGAAQGLRPQCVRQ